MFKSTLPLLFLFIFMGAVFSVFTAGCAGDTDRDDAIEYEVIVKPEDETKGTVSGGGTYRKGERTSVEAEPNEGYIFAGWFAITENQEYIASTRKNYSFSAGENLKLVALFLDAEEEQEAPGDLPQLFETRIVVGESVEGRPIEAVMLGTGDDVTLILATIHGDEQAGTPLLQELIRELRDNPSVLLERRVVVMPVANPDGRAANRRHNANGVDLNRNFPAPNRVNSRIFGLEALSEPEARALYRVIDTQQPDRFVSIHQPLACVDYDGPGKDLAQRMSEASGLPVRKLGAQPGSLGSYVGMTLGRPIITLELPRDADDLHHAQLWERYGPALIEAIRYEP